VIFTTENYSVQEDIRDYLILLCFLWLKIVPKKIFVCKREEAESAEGLLDVYRSHGFRVPKSKALLGLDI
jgi:hypothetical protein